MRVRLNREFGFQSIAFALGIAFLIALAFAASPQLHARFHHDSGSPDHECAATLIAAGSYEHFVPPIVLLPPQPVVQIATVPTFQSVWVEASFLGASIFEHAPPVVS